MTSRDFCYWLQGYMELSEASSASGVGFSPTQRAKIEAHLALVFVHEIDPSMGNAEHQAKLDEVHGSNTEKTQSILHAAKKPMGPMRC